MFGMWSILKCAKMRMNRCDLFLLTDSNYAWEERGSYLRKKISGKAWPKGGQVDGEEG